MTALPFAPTALLIPNSLTSLIGREHEVAALVELLRNSTVRLLTLTGPGGVGKTRLALAMAEELAPDFTDGAVFVSLAQITDPDRVTPTITHTLGVRDLTGTPLRDLLHDVLRHKHLLLILDNFEHLVEAAPLLVEILTVSPNLTILVTSRMRLRITSEHEHPVAPLAVVEGDKASACEEIAASAAVRLFVERAQAVCEDFELTADNAATIAAISRYLDGLPLAIELAAAWLKVLPPSSLLTQLEQRLPLLTSGSRDLPDRQRTMRDAIAWSYDLLDDAEQDLFRRLALFVNGFTLAAGESVARGEVRNILPGLANLVDASLLQQRIDPDGTPRYQMLATIREYGLEQLAASGEEHAVRAAHAAYFLQLAETALPHYDGPGNPLWLERIDADHDNLRSAMTWAAEHGALETMARTAGALWRFWVVRGHFTEGYAWLQRASEIHIAAGRSLPVEAWIGLAGMEIWLCGTDGDRTSAEALLTHCRANDDPYGAFWALIWLGEIAFAQQDDEQAATCWEQALTLAPVTRTPEGYAAVALRSLADLALRSNDLALAAERNENALQLFRMSGNQWGEAWSLAALGTLACTQRDLQKAAALLGQSLAIRNALHDGPGVSEVLAGLADVAIKFGDMVCAARLLGAVASLRETVGLQKSTIFIPEVDIGEARNAAQAKLGASAFDDAFAEGQALSLAEALDEAAAFISRVALGSTDRHRGTSTNTFGLTPRELQVLRLIADGARDHEIADLLGISRRTVTTYVTSILNKLGLDSRTAAATYAVRQGLL
jgi:predicted ATPase/DNA-binding NarL/FixJ family response regulator